MNRSLPVALLFAACGSVPPAQRPGAAGLRMEVEVLRRPEGLRAPAEEPDQPPAAAALPEGPGVVRIRATADGAPGFGARSPVVTIVEFADFQCPFSARVQTTLHQLVATHPEDVRVVFRHRPLPSHPAAGPAAEAAVEAQVQGGDDLFFRMHDLLFAGQRSLHSRAEILRFGVQAGLDRSRLDRALESGAHRARVAEESALAERLGANATPSFFVNGRAIQGAHPLQDFEAIVAEEIAHATRLVAAGVRREDVGDHVLRNALDSAPPRPAPAPAPPREPEPDVVHFVPIGNSPVRGPNDALVTIVEFADFQCPFSNRVREVLRPIETRFGADVRLVYKHQPLPFHPQAMPAAEASVEAFVQGGAARFFQMHDLLFDGQRNLGPLEIERHARTARLRMGPFRRAIQRHTHRAVVDGDVALAARLEARGTPTFFVNGRVLRGAQPLEAFAAVIERELVAARARVASGTPRAAVYDAIMAEAAR